MAIHISSYLFNIFIFTIANIYIYSIYIYIYDEYKFNHNPTAKVELMKLTKVIEQVCLQCGKHPVLQTGIRFFTCPPTYNKVAGALVTMEDGKQVLDPMLVFWIVEW